MHGQSMSFHPGVSNSRTWTIISFRVRVMVRLGVGVTVRVRRVMVRLGVGVTVRVRRVMVRVGVGVTVRVRRVMVRVGVGAGNMPLEED